MRKIPTLMCAGLLALPVLALAQSAPPAPASAEDTLVLSPFTITSTRDKGYGTTNSLGASRFTVPIQNIPGSVITVNREVIQDVAAFEFSDALRFVSGVAITSSPLNGQLTIRGQGVGVSALRDGLPEGIGMGGGSFFDFAPYERIEVIKGPSGSLYGSHSVGGIVNRVSKQPLGTFMADASASTKTSNGQTIWRGDIDVTGPVDDAGKARYRVIGAISEGKIWNNRNYERQVLAPMFTYSPRSDILLWARWEYQFADIANTANAWFANAKGQISTFIPRDDVSDDPWESMRLWKSYLEGGAEKRFFNGAFVSRLTARYNDEDRNHYRYIKSAAGSIRFYDKSGAFIGTESSTAVDFSDPSVFGSITHARQYAPETQNQISRNLYWDNIASFKVGPAEHKLLVYGALGSLDSGNRRSVSAVAATPVFDYLHPVYDPVFNSSGLPLTVSVNTVGSGESYNFGAQDNVSMFNERVILVAGARRDHSENNNTNLMNNTATANTGQDTSYKLGLVGKPLPGFALFYNYSQTFNPQFGTYFRYPDLAVLPRENQTGVMNEYGAKLDLFDSRLVATASWFEINTDNNYASGPTINGTPTTVLLGDVTAKGWEADIAYQPVPQLNLMVGLSDMDSKTATGVRQSNVAQGLSYRALAKYSFTSGRLRNLFLGAGYEYTNERAGDAADTFTLPAFGIWTAFAGYRLGDWRLQVNVDNLTDKVYALSSPQRTLVFPGDPRTVKFTVGYRF